ncbi:MAG: hypothetical protein ABH852_05570 [Methanobacteriota archaeon]
MNIRRDRKGFFFSLDATLGVLVVIIVIAGVARIGGTGQTYEQHGNLKLQRYANDALEVLQLTDTLDSIVNNVEAGNLRPAENLARTLREMLPAEIQFKFVIGDNRLTVYPSDTADWATAFSGAKELGVAVRMTTFSEASTRFEPITLYVWRGVEVS